MEPAQIKLVVRIVIVTIAALMIGQWLFRPGELQKQRVQVDREFRRYETVNNLYSRGFELKQMIGFFHMEKARLPERADFDWFNCGVGAMDCPFHERLGTYYIRDGDHWFSLTPYLDGGELKYRCEITVWIDNDPTTRGLPDCKRVAKESLPFRWREDGPLILAR